MDYFRLGCSSAQSRRLTSALAGGLAAYSGADQLLVDYGLKPEVHWALTGVATDLFCRGTSKVVDPILETGVSAVAGYVGAMAAKQVLPRLPKLL